MVDPCYQKKLQFEDFSEFYAFPTEILEEIIREGERYLDARLTTANSADQRALALLGFQLTLTLAVGGGLISLLMRQTVNEFLVICGLIQIILMGIASFQAYCSVKPKLFRFPGNSPHLWFVENWERSPYSPYSARLKDARVEQCYALYSAIYDNKEVMEENASLIKNSMALTMASSIFSVSVVVIWSILRVCS